jgi:hypothetical protein
VCEKLQCDEETIALAVMQIVPRERSKELVRVGIDKHQNSVRVVQKHVRGVRELVERIFSFQQDKPLRSLRHAEFVVNVLVLFVVEVEFYLC